MPERVFLYDVTRDEHEAFITRLIRYAYRPILQWLKLIAFDLILASVLGAATYGLTQDLSSGGVVGVGVMAIALFYHCFINQDVVEKVVRKHMENNGYDFPISVRIAFVNQTVEIAVSDKAFVIPMSPSLRVFRVDDWTDVVALDVGAGFGLPDRVFKNEEDRIEFTEMLDRRFANE